MRADTCEREGCGRDGGSRSPSHRHQHSAYASDVAAVVKFAVVTDRSGRWLPPPDWPQHRSAPDGLEFVRRFINTTNRTSGADLLDHTGDLDDWLRGQGHRAVRAHADALAELRDVREWLRALAGANHDANHGALGATAVGELPTTPSCVSACRLSVAVRGGDVVIEPADESSPAVLVGDLLIAVATAQAIGTWPRLKSCSESHCTWAFYDTSNNVSSRWCSMNICGGRAKARSYRRRAAALPLVP